MARVKPLALAGRWQGSEGEYVATIKGSKIIWPDQSQKEFHIQCDLTKNQLDQEQIDHEHWIREIDIHTDIYIDTIN
jgi:hypothetical protein